MPERNFPDSQEERQKYTSMESIVNECLQYSLGAEGYQETFDRLLSFIGKTFQCARAYIFELNKNDTFSNTYEWCSPESISQKELLQNESIDTIDWWMETFRDNRLVIINDLEAIKGTYPSVYAALRPQEVSSLIVCPLRSKDQIIGFMGVDNPKPNQMPLIVSFLHVIEYFVVSFLKRRDLSYRLSYVSYHDQLTGALNRSAYKEKEKKLQGNICVGILYSDVSGLKRENDLFGHAAGDRLICRCYEMLCQAFDKGFIYRMGGDEFMVICTNITHREFQEKCYRLRSVINRGDCHLAIGASWGCLLENSIEALASKAEEEMYRDKREYYNKMNSVTGIRHEYRDPDMRGNWVGRKPQTDIKTLKQYLQHNPDSLAPMIESTEIADSPICLYLGDLRTNIFYISDNMREIFGFGSNTVYDLLTKWERRICHQEDLESYRRDIKNIWNNNQKKHDFKYRVYDGEGKMIWIHCRGILYRDENGEPRYFAGFVSRPEFLVDPVTNLPRENAAVSKLEIIRQRGQHTIVFGIGLKHFAEINETKGRAVADSLLQDISMYWENQMSNKAWFYRLDGVAFMAVIKPECTESVDSLIASLRDSVKYYFRKWNVVVKSCCSFCVFHYPSDIETPEIFVEKVISFIEVAKSQTENEYISYSAQTIDKYKENAGLVLRLSEDVVNSYYNFRIVIQPIVSAAEGKIEGGEVLLRWRYMDRDVPPAIFIPLLEKKGLISQVGRWVFEEAVRHCARIVADHPRFHLSFNVSYLQIMDEGFIPFMEEMLKKYRINGKNLIMELTEAHFDDEPEKLMRFLNGCKKLGMSIALDDFGSGYSSMGLLIKYPSNVVKLDRSLLNGLTDSPDKQMFLKTVIFACHQFGKLVCVEGVEEPEEVQIVQETGSDMIQGYHFYRPLELGDFYGVLNKNQAVEKI
ncbi:MAG: EAL domain-containing protein [Eubacteriales bacterium]|nr:EAL domain-containing protein [Eubacteriales bacterium]